MAHIEQGVRRRGLVYAAVCLLALCGAILWTVPTWASGPRWVTGPPYFTGPAGIPVGWYTGQPLYFTDPGDLSPYVNHAAAEAMVSAAASVWNVPTANILLNRGGSLAEHVSGANSYLSSTGPVLPADVQSSNYAAIQIAVIYDSDGSIINLLLGAGGSDPSGCRQNGVIDSVDSISPAGHIQHALVVVNGLCSGPAPEQQLELQYQMERSFGRILGVGWTQTNEIVFSASVQPTHDQALHWPIMHPLDIVCGFYTYQCLPQPFTLRDDDVGALTQLYLNGYSNWSGWVGGGVPEKILSYTDAGHVYGTVTFPNGQGMQGVNVVVERQHANWNAPEGWQETSSVTGFLYQQQGPDPMVASGTGAGASLGTTNGPTEGYYDLTWIPMIDSAQTQEDLIISTEPINPLYTGTESVGPYQLGQVYPSGSSMSQFVQGLQPNTAGYYALVASFAPQDAVSSCNTSGDGLETAPAPVAATGMWNDTLCGYGHTAWSSFATKPGRTATIEVFTLNEQGQGTLAKAMPLIGAWGANAPTGTLPTVGTSFATNNTFTVGLTTLTVPTGATGTNAAGGLRFAIGDERGDGRPDFRYQARVLYADSVTPAGTSLNGGQITIHGMGFEAGNQVLVNGVNATVTSLTPNTIVAIAPPDSLFRTIPAFPVSVQVKDLATTGSATISSALSYGGVLPDEMVLVSAPSGTVALGSAVTVPFAVRVLMGDGVTPVVGLPVTFAASGVAATLSACGLPSCSIVTDSTGLASALVTPDTFGTVTLLASAVGASASAIFNVASRSVTAVRAVEYLAAGASMTWNPGLTVTLNGAAAAGVEVDWTGATGLVVSAASSTVSALGVAQISASSGPLAAGVQATGQACAWAGAFCTSFAAVGVDPSVWQMAAVSGAGQSLPLTGTFAPLVMMVTDAVGHPVAGAPVTIHQTITEAATACAVHGDCPIAPVLQESTSTAVSDVNGLVSVTPIQMAGVSEVTKVAVSSGTQGFASLTVSQGASGSGSR